MAMTPAEYLKRAYSRVVVPESDGTFRCEILEFPGCIASGDTAAQALANLEDVAESWLASTLARGQPIPEPIEENEFSGKLVLRWAKSMHRKAARAARYDGVSLNTFIGNCVAECLGARKVAPMNHYITNLSQQNNLVFLGEKTFMTTSTGKYSVSTGQTSMTVTGTATANADANPNPWQQPQQEQPHG
jgi:predicted RNase H-like HicB family nuclease